MKIWLLRHGRTAWNEEGRYQGRRSDILLSAEGEAELIPAPFTPEAVYVTPLRRTHQTAARIFPGVPQRVAEGLAEMDFGAFDGRTAQEMACDGAYRAWVDGGCAGRCPGGEDLLEFEKRVRGAFMPLAEAPGDGPLVIVAHGGVLMALMERFALPERRFYEWLPPNGGGYHLEREPALWAERRKLRLLEAVRYVRC